MTHASNVLGTVQPIETIAPLVREAGAFFLVDAAQSAGVVPINLDATRPSICSPSPVTRPSMDRPARVPCMSDQERTARSVPGGRGEPAAIRRARPSRPCCPTCWKAERPTYWALRVLPPESTGSWNEVRTTCGLTRSACCSRSWTGQRGPQPGASPGAGIRQPTSVRSRWSCPRDSRPRIWARSSMSASRSPSVRDCIVPRIFIAPLHTFPDGTLRLSPGPFTTPQQIDRFVEALTEITAGVL